MSLPTLGIRHVALNVSDAQRSKEFYIRVLQMQLEWEPDASAEQVAALAAALEAKYPQYEGQPFVRVLVLRIVGMSGWAAAEH